MPLLRVYIETSVWSFVFADDVPDYRRDTLAFFDRVRSGKIEPVVSVIVLQELARSDPPLRKNLMALVGEIHPTVIGVTDELNRLADAFVHHGVVPRGKPEDAAHVAAAFVEELDVLVSWNFKHIASVRRADRFNAVATLEGFLKPLRIVSPAEVLFDEEKDEF
ncbi:MAG: hypothetical protein L0Y44_10715 [Phycisphaerales bacterium]|nr:hypothetical protein [Phycisphaerales bacterium]MCI0631110.1 hypothetical protein [Phycisphaerales bacterium]MCI0675432.1 hypothetical protein [Phycisphaerales bacterium]